MATVKFTSKQFFLTLNIFLIALIIGLTGFATAVYIMLMNNPVIDVAIDPKIAFGICGALTLSGIVGSTFIYKKKVQDAKTKSLLKDQLQTYRIAIIIRYALLEAPGLAGIVFFMLTGIPLLLLFPLASIVLMVYTRPGLKKTIEELQLDFKSQEMLENPETVLYETETNTSD